MTAEAWRQVADTLSNAADLAERRWHPNQYDIYHCLSTAWRGRGTDTVVPWTAVTGAVRALVPSGDISGRNDTEGRSRADVAALLVQAARRVTLRVVA